MNMNLTKYEIDDLIDRLQKGETIPDDFKYKLFPVKQKEYELVYGGKMRREDILANEDGTFPIPLQIEKIYNGHREQWKDDWRNIIAFGDNLQFLKTIYENKDPLIKNKVKGKVKLIYIDPPFGTGDEYDGNTGQAAYSAKIKGAEFVEFIRKRIVVAKEILANDGWIFVRQGFHFGHYIKIALDEVFGKHNFINEMIVSRIKKNVTDKGRRNIPNAVDHIFVYKKSEDSNYVDVLKNIGTEKEGYWHAMDSAGIPGPRFLVIEGKTHYPPTGRHFTFPQDQADEKYKSGKLRINSKTRKLQYWIEPKIKFNLDSNWTDIPGYTFTTGYPTENSESLLERVIRATTVEGDIVLDFFGGSGTTAAVAEKLNRKWITCDIGKLALYTIQKRLLNIESSKSIDNPKKQYGKEAKSFVSVNTGHYDLAKIFELKQQEYSDFVMKLFEVEPKQKIISGIQIDGEKKDGYNVIIWQYWKFKDSTVDEDFLHNLHSHIGTKAGKRVYIIAPANYVDFISDYYEIEKVRYYFLKVPYHIIRELHKVEFKKFRQPQSKSNVNDLEDAIGFHFMRQPEVKSELKEIDGDYHITIKKFLSDFSEEEIQRDMENFESLSMVLIDKDFSGNEFDMDAYYFAEDLLPKKKKKQDEEENENIKEELKHINQISLPPFPKNDCGERMMVIYIDIYGNEFKEEFKLIK
ncbi:MAG: site-specific DNA-methyltransferase [Candidatus Methanoperedens sp.]|nr:site-specific DNA-methyltransferase [Candidatus Methanoperedens sp.]